MIFFHFQLFVFWIISRRDSLNPKMLILRRLEQKPIQTRTTLFPFLSFFLPISYTLSQLPVLTVVLPRNGNQPIRRQVDLLDPRTPHLDEWRICDRWWRISNHQHFRINSPCQQAVYGQVDSRLAWKGFFFLIFLVFFFFFLFWKV